MKTYRTRLRRNLWVSCLAAIALLAFLACLAPRQSLGESGESVTAEGMIQEYAAGKSLKLKTKTGVEAIVLSDETLVKGKLAKGVSATVIYDKESRLAEAVVAAKGKPAVKPKETTAPPATDKPKTAPSSAGIANPKAAEANWAKARGKLMEVVVSGSGKTLDDAKRHAYQAAVEQSFGVLVDAGSLVENDKLIDDFALTFVDGDVHDWKLLDQAESGGLHHVRIRASVSVEKLAARLRAKNIAMRDLPGEMFYKTAVEAIATQEDALAALKETLGRFGPDKLIRPLIVERPEVLDQNDDFATLSVKVQAAGDRAEWKSFRDEILRLLTTDRKTKASKLTAESPDGEYGDSMFYALQFNDEVGGKMYEMQGKDSTYGYWLMVLKDLAAPGQPHKLTSAWETFWVNKAVAPIFESLMEKEYLLRVAVMDADNRVLAETDRKLTMWTNPVRALHLSHNGGWSRDEYYLAPFFWGDGHYYCPKWNFEPFLVDIALFDLKNATRVVATIEEAPLGKKE